MRTKACFAILMFSVIATCSAQDADDDVTIETVDDGDVAYESPKPLDASKVYFADHFDSPSGFDKNWIKSEAKKEGIEEDIAKYDGLWDVEAPQKDGLKGDLGLVLKSKAKHAAIAAPLIRPFIFKDKPLIVQYEVLLQEGQECGGAYLKLLSQASDSKNLKNFHDKTPYSIMFGPDKCGNDHKLHFIFKHKNPKNGSVEEKHCEKPKERLEESFSDKLPHLYTLIIRPDNTFDIQIDRKSIKSGSLLEDFAPPVNPPVEIEDPDDKKPEDWDEREKIPDPNAVKPEDWDEDAPAQIVDESAGIPDGWLENEPTHLPDPTAQKPADWDTDMDGEWEPPLIENPACSDAPGCGPWEPPLVNNPAFKGKWRASLVDNPNYKGKWRPRKIPNPDFFEDQEPFKMQPISAIGFELWSMSKDILFDNIIITEEIEVAEHWASATFDKKRQKIASDSVSVWGRLMKSLNYNPQGWGLYFVYCAIPVACYIYYIYKCVKEESVVQKLANLTNDYPILWALYIIGLGLPVVFILYLCCKPATSQSQESEELKQAAERKKTDEQTENNEAEINEEANITEVNEDEEEERDSGKDDEDAEKNSNPDSEEDNEVVEEDVAFENDCRFAVETLARHQSLISKQDPEIGAHSRRRRNSKTEGP